MRKSVVFAGILCTVVLIAIIAGACGSSKNQAQSESTPTESAASGTATPVSGDDTYIDSVIQQLFWDYEHVKDVTIDGKTDYTDPSDTDWIRFGECDGRHHFVRDPNQEQAARYPE